MRILVVSDLHYSLKQFDWLVENCGGYDLIIVAGDLMELGSYVDPEVQAAVVERYFRKICSRVPMVVCSGNHDLIDEGEGERTAEWLADISIYGLVVDHGVYEDESIRILSLPWWEGDAERERVESWLQSQMVPDDRRPVFWVHHAPPKGSKTSWDGKRDLGDKWVAKWIEKFNPTLVLTGHVHNAPYHEGGAWFDRIGGTLVTNGGRQTGRVPATIEVEVENGDLVWCGMEGCERATLSAT